MKDLLLILMIVACIFAVGCGADQPGKADISNVVETSENAESSSGIDGTVLEAEKFSMTGADGWNSMEIPGGFQVYKGNELLEVSVYGYNMTEADDLASMESFIDKYDGTPIETVQLWGLEFKKTTFVCNGLNQTLMTCIKDGEQVKVQTGEKDGENPEIAAMIESVVFK